MLYQCVTDYTVLTEQVVWWKDTFNTGWWCHMLTASGVKACFCDHHHSAGDMDDCT